jgi:hypothetical protein
MRAVRRGLEFGSGPHGHLCSSGRLFLKREGLRPLPRNLRASSSEMVPAAASWTAFSIELDFFSFRTLARLGVLEH